MVLNLLKTCLRGTPIACLLGEDVAVLEEDVLARENDLNEDMPVFDEDVCPICFGEIEEDEKEVLDCGHEFHKTCILELIRHNNKCPKCRAHIHTCRWTMFMYVTE